MIYNGSCHCGAVSFEVEGSTHMEVIECNCSICTKSGYLQTIVPRDRFSLISGEDQITTYTFNTGVAKHTFCKTCGIKSFYTPRSNPDCVAVNVRCLDPIPVSIKVTNFDGQHWEENIHKLHEGK